MARISLQPLHDNFRDQLGLSRARRAFNCQEILYAEGFGENVLFFIVEVLVGRSDSADFEQRPGCFGSKIRFLSDGLTVRS